MKKTLALGLACFTISAIAPSPAKANEPRKSPELHQRSMEYLTEFERAHQAAFGRTSPIALNNQNAVEQWRSLLNWRVESAIAYCKFLRNGGNPDSDKFDTVAEELVRNRPTPVRNAESAAKELRQEFLVMMSIAPKHFCPEKTKS
ncbi:hypothetical protein IQ250_27205 [Pseudanabaenaceae cyanobacterium LEGE 13415]|nr:hypothetical protein [Pseudanabaenaceae cyanobacterium LEGE 13415]